MTVTATDNLRICVIKGYHKSNSEKVQVYLFFYHVYSELLSLKTYHPIILHLPLGH